MSNLTVPLGIASGYVLPKKTVKEARGFDLGERNPDKLDYDDTHGGERQKFWERRRRLVQAGKLIGSKY